MRIKRYIAILLLFVSMIMLAMPVIPHHHHSGNELLCMKSDVQTGCCEHHHSTHNATETHDHCCCNTGCVTTHFVQKAPSVGQNNLHPDYQWVITLFHEPIFRFLFQTESKEQKQYSTYIESLHGVFLTSAKGLRAPPYVLA
ncbi:MAG: hypothetical protein Q4D56_12090 [Bacteroides sp.]|nr:hypothetical protein [Bacteroides sp.]